MSDANDIVDDAILESYLIGLTEQQIWADLGHFVTCCRKVVRGHVKDEAAGARLGEVLARAGRCTLAQESRQIPASPFSADGVLKGPRERFAQKAARNKRLAMRAIEQYDPRLVALIQKELYRAAPRRRGRRRALTPKARLLVLRGLYVAMVVCLFLLVYLMIARG